MSWLDEGLSEPAKAPRPRVVFTPQAAQPRDVASEPVEAEAEAELGVRRVASRAGGPGGRARASTSDAEGSAEDAPAGSLADADVASAIAAEEAANRAAGDP